ncbi:MAG: Unknown protein [uncultured Aureispira sp.]|uniref:Uncharacterized protein n=1 Tax=uncultured Aureispira sp. TaxID=1331704 RepID=A0A6S6RXR7_9BACT|nr:MAG: Unknown protein [uncultured Aureispira sp.]
MSCWIMVLGFMLGAAVMGYMLAWFLQPVNDGSPQPLANPQGDGDGIAQKRAKDEKSKRDLEKMKKRYDELYNSKLDVDTALVAAESTLDGLKMDYERLERDMSGNNNRHKELQVDFDKYKDKKESEIKELRTKTKKANDGYETIKFQLAKSNRINEKLQEGLSQLKEENQKLSTELEEANEEMEVVNASMTELKVDYTDLQNKALTYNDRLAEWQAKYEGLNLSYETSEQEKMELIKSHETYKVNTGSEIEKLSGHLNSLQSQLAQSTQYTNEYAEAYSTLESNHEELSLELEEQRKAAAAELNEIQDNFKALEADYDSIQEREKVLDERFGSLQDKHTDLEDAYHNTVEEKQNLELAYNEYKQSTIDKYSELEKDAKTWVERLEASTAEMSQHKEKAAELEENKKQLILELEKTRKRYEKDLSLSGGEMDALNDTFEDLKERYFKVNKELSSTRLEKERINYQHESFQEQVMNELELVRNENKRLNKILLEVKTEKHSLEFSKEELLARIQTLEEMGGAATPDQAKLIKVINRLKNSVNSHQEQLKQFELEKLTYETRIESLEQQLKEQTNSGTEQHLMEQQKKDNFKTIKGLTAATAEILNDFGIYTYMDLADLSNENKDLLHQVIEASEAHIDKWMLEAKQLAKEA